MLLSTQRRRCKQPKLGSHRRSGRDHHRECRDDRRLLTDETVLAEQARDLRKHF